ncbi:hypothetical protein [Streptomyces albidus (ex Kaewkla and Franco 2022)]|uniref:hypothetical protein n=1 Tax=Streptomyces albidus (ex Kaewkla and Franco 2022) TaxID=722709 RepID=UPI0015EFB6C8|nr:hypothetical protein [Streptomyces albidus (ex Kaewkla and Franco 2022)]
MSEIKVGKPHVQLDGTAHTPGVRQGNQEGLMKRQPGHLPDDTSTARRSTGINSAAQDPILPGMPNLSPA